MTDHRPATPHLDRIAAPADLRSLSNAELRQIADELRSETISAVSVTGGHLGAGLGVVELTVAIHAVFNTPRDKLIWDVGHQCYPHKILTGRRDRIRTLRAGGGLSGFTRRSESPYDAFGAAHSSTSISAGLGYAAARDLGAPDVGDVVCVIGDGAMSAGMAYEALNNAGHLKKRIFVILNDNEMSIAPPVGAMSSYLARLYAGEPFQDLYSVAKGAVRLLPHPLQEGAKRARDVVKHATVGGTLFEELGFSYVGPVDGHDMDQLLHTLRTAKARATGPILIHALTKKGKGYAPAEAATDKYHGVDEIRRGQRRPGQGGFERAELHQGLRPVSHQGGRARRPHRRRHRRHARRHRAQPVRRTLPETLLRRGHRRAAWRHLLRRPRRRRHEALRRDLLDLPAARLRPGGARRGDPAPAGAVRHRPRRARGRRRRHPRRRRSTSPSSRTCPASW